MTSLCCVAGQITQLAPLRRPAVTSLALVRSWPDSSPRRSSPSCLLLGSRRRLDVSTVVPHHQSGCHSGDISRQSGTEQVRHWCRPHRGEPHRSGNRLQLLARFKPVHSRNPVLRLTRLTIEMAAFAPNRVQRSSVSRSTDSRCSLHDGVNPCSIDRLAFRFLIVLSNVLCVILQLRCSASDHKLVCIKRLLI